jgi:hypothetical protein
MAIKRGMKQKMFREKQPRASGSGFGEPQKNRGGRLAAPGD